MLPRRSESAAGQSLCEASYSADRADLSISALDASNLPRNQTAGLRQPALWSALLVGAGATAKALGIPSKAVGRVVGVPAQ